MEEPNRPPLKDSIDLCRGVEVSRTEHINFIPRLYITNVRDLGEIFPLSAAISVLGITIWHSILGFDPKTLLIHSGVRSAKS